MTDYADYQTPQAHATAIYGTKVPLARSVTAVGSAIGATLNAGVNTPLFVNVAIDQPGWELEFQASLPGAVGTVPFALLRLQFLKSATTLIISNRPMYAQVGQSTNQGVATGGYGPVRGDVVSLSLTNLDPAQVMTYSYAFSAVSHPHIRDVWRQDDYTAFPPATFTWPSGEPGIGWLATSTPSIGPGGSTSRLIATYLGKVRMQIDNSANANAIQVTITDPVGNVTPSANYYDQTVAASALQRDEIWLPAKPVLLTMKNTGGAGNITGNVTLISSDY